MQYNTFNMTELFLVRHPESVLNADRKFIAGRSASAAVTERGMEQARRFVHTFTSLYPKPDVYYSSPTVRTKTLLEVYAQITGQQVEYTIDSDLLEMAQGINEGKLRSEVYTTDVITEISKKEFDFSFPGSESLNDTANRAEAFIARVHKNHPNSVVLASTHGQFIRAYVGRLLQWSHYQTTIDPTHYINNVSLTHLTIDGDNVTVHFWGKDIIEPVEIETTEV
jgi:broad specificity phosphatase PhoE